MSGLGAAAAAGRARAAGRVPWRGIAEQTVLQLRLLLRSPESLLVTVALPVGALLLFGTVDVLPTGDGDPTTFLLAGTLALAVMASGLVAAAIQTAFERQYGVLKLLGSTPLPRWGFVLAKTAAVLALVVVQAALLVGLATALLDGSLDGIAGARWAGLLGALALGALVFTAIGQALAGALPAMVTLAVSNGLFVVLLATGGLVFAAEELPGVVQAVGAVGPAALLGDALRALLDGGDASSLAALAGLVGWGVLALLVASRTFRWEP